VTKPKHVRKRKDDSPESEDEDNGYSAGGDEPEDEDNDLDDGPDLDGIQDLQVLSGQELKVVLRTEVGSVSLSFTQICLLPILKQRPQWNAAAHLDEDDEDGVDIPDSNFCDITTASEVDPTATDDDEEDEDEGEGDQDDEDESHPHHRRMVVPLLAVTS